MDFCKFFSDIEKDPTAPVNITVRQNIEAGDHVRTCPTCYAICERVAGSTDNSNGISIGLN